MSQPNSSSTDARVLAPRRRPLLLQAVAACCVLLMGWKLYWAILGHREANAKPAQPEHVQSNQQNADAQWRRLAIGTWQDDYQGKRTMTLREDGSGTMLVELSGLKATLFAPKLTFEMTWSIEAGRLKKQTLRGEPSAQVSLILKTMGDRVDEPILELTEDRLLLVDQDGKTKYDWRRVHKPG